VPKISILIACMRVLLNPFDNVFEFFLRKFALDPREPLAAYQPHKNILRLHVENRSKIVSHDPLVLYEIEKVEEANKTGIRPLVAVNISGRSLQSNMFVQALTDLLAANDPIREQLVLEVTETSEIKDLGAVNEILQEFRRKRNKVCIDDFGSGAAAFQYLRTLDVDVVKIDGSYIDRILWADRDRALVLAIQRLCAELGIQTVAEKVEMPDQAQVLRTIGIDKGQGWLFGKPDENIDQFFRKKKDTIDNKELMGEGHDEEMATASNN